MRHFLYPIEGSNIVERVDAGRQTSVQAEYLVVDQGGQRQVIEEIREVFPDIRITVLAQALVVETVNLGDLS